jgi:hypothetical protein
VFYARPGNLLPCTGLHRPTYGSHRTTPTHCHVTRRRNSPVIDRSSSRATQTRPPLTSSPGARHRACRCLTVTAPGRCSATRYHWYLVPSRPHARGETYAANAGAAQKSPHFRRRSAFFSSQCYRVLFDATIFSVAACPLDRAEFLLNCYDHAYIVLIW